MRIILSYFSVFEQRVASWLSEFPGSDLFVVDGGVGWGALENSLLMVWGPILLRPFLYA